MGLGIKSLQKKNGKLEQCECKAIPNGSTGDGRAPYLEKLYILYILRRFFRFFCFFVVFCVFSCFFFGDSIQNSEYSFFLSVLPLARLTVNFFEHEKHIRTLMGPPLCTPFSRYVTTLATYSLHIPPLSDANMKY